MSEHNLIMSEIAIAALQQKLADAKKELAAKDARIAELEAALQPFAEAVKDKDVKAYLEADCADFGLEIPRPIVTESRAIASARYVYIITGGWRLSLQHLVDAAVALKGKSE